MKKFLRALALSLALMMLLSAAALADTIRFRDKGDDVLKLQTALKQLSLYEGELDGQFGSGTLKAVKAFQKAQELTVDGLAGVKTQAKLTELTGIVFDDDAAETPDTPVEPDAPSVPETPDAPGEEEPEVKGLFAGDYRKMQIPTKGDRVRILQRALAALGFDVDVDGDYGANTRKAVMAFQRVVGLTQDGVAGEKTLKKLETYFNDEGECISGPIAGNAPAEPEVDPNAPVYGLPERVLRYGSKGLDVKYVMQRLYDLEYYNGKVDEYFGSGMLKAVKAFQKKNGLTVDGVLGVQSIAKLFAEDVLDADDAIPEKEEDTTGRTLKKGLSGEDVKAAQVRLASLGYYDGELDGKFGSGTLAAVKLFQARNALKVDGLVGPRTLERLMSEDAVPADSALVPLN